MKIQRPWLLVGLIFGLVAIVGVACGGTDEDALTSADISSAVQQAVAAAQQPAGLSGEEIAALVSGAVDEAVKGIEFPQGVTASDIQAAVDTATAGLGEGASQEDIEAAIDAAVSKAAGEGLSKADVEAIVSAAVKSIPTPATIVMVVTPTPLVLLATPEPARIDLPGPKTAAGTINIVTADFVSEVGLGRDGGGSEFYNFIGIGESLFMPKADGTIQGPLLAKSFVIATDLSKATITIQDGVMFHKDYGEMTSEDVVWSINDANAAVTSSSIHAQAGDFAVLFLEATAVDSSTFDLPFATFDPAWDGNRTNQSGNSFGVLSKKAFDQNGAEWSRDNVVATGPFEVSSWVSGDKIVLSAVADHWRKPPEFDTLQFVAIPEGTTRLAAMLTGEGDVIAPIVFKDLSRLASAGFKTQGGGGGRKAAIFWGGNYWEDTTVNASTGGALPDIGLTYDPGVPWAVAVQHVDPAEVDEKMERARQVRTAMSMAIDRELINETIMDGLAWAEYMWSASVIQPEWQDRWRIPYDPAAAEQMLDDAGYPRGSDGVRFNADIFRAQAGSEIPDAVAGFWDEIGIRTIVDKSAYTTVRPSFVARSFVKINIQRIGETATNRPFDWPKGGEMTSLGRGGFGPGVEVPEITQAIIDAGNEPDRLKRVAINTALIDYMRFMMQGSAVVAIPSLIVYNPNAIESWAMPPHLGLDPIGYPEFITPAAR